MTTPKTTNIPSNRLPNWFQAAVVGSFFVGGFAIVAHWQGTNSAVLLLVWLPVLHGLATLASKRRQTVEELRATPLWFAVSQPKAHEQPLGYGRTFQFDDELTRIHAKQQYSENEVYYFNIDTGLSWFSGDEIGQQLDFHLGVRTNVLEMKCHQAQLLAQKCRDYVAATRRFHQYFALAWIGAVALPFFATFEQNEILLGTAIWVVVMWGVLPRWSMRESDRGLRVRVPPAHACLFLLSGRQ